MKRFNNNSPDPEDITGVILDGESSEPLPYATIGLKHNGKGTVSNSSGEFGIKISTRKLQRYN